MLIIKWTEPVSNEQVLKKMRLKQTHILRIRKRRWKFIGQKMEKESLKNLTFTRHTEGKQGRG